MDSIITIFYIFYIITNHAFNKIGILMNARLDQEMKIAEGSNWIAMITSTIFAAIGKLFGSFMEITSIRYALTSLFLLNGIIMYFSLTTSNIYFFMICRNLQGLVSGLQTSIIIGFISLLKNNKQGFASFSGVSALVSLSTGIMLEIFTTKNIGIMLLCINTIASLIVCWSLRFFNQTYKTVPIVKSAMIEAISRYRFLLYAILLGILLGVALFITGKQVNITEILSPTSHKFFIASIDFVFAAIVSFLPFMQHSLVGFGVISFGFGMFTYGVYINYFNYIIVGCMTAFTTFAIVSPVVAHNVTKITNDKFVNSTLFFAIRSFFTAGTLYVIGKIKLPLIQLIQYSFGLLWIIVIFIVILDYSDTNKENS